jgi:hypothetical protein
MESAARQDDALNKEGKLLTIVTGKSGRERKVIMTEFGGPAERWQERVVPQKGFEGLPLIPSLTHKIRNTRESHDVFCIVHTAKRDHNK